MKFLYITLILIFFMSCRPKDVKIPVNDNPGIHEVWDNSPVYILIKTDNKDTLADAKLGQTMSTTKWLVAIDRRLNLRQLRPALEKVLKKRRKKSIHSDGKGQLYFTYLDSVQQKVSFINASDILLMPDYFKSQDYFKQYSQVDKDFDKIHLSIQNHQYFINEHLIKAENISKNALRDSIQNFAKKRQMTQPVLYLNFDSRLKYACFLDVYTFFKNDSLSNVRLSPKIFIFTP